MNVDGSGNVVASGAWYAGTCNLQGAASYTTSSNKTYFLLNSTRSSGKLYVGQASKTIGKAKAASASSGQWGYMPEGIYVTTKNNAWISTEGHSSLDRAIYYVNVDTLLSKLGL